MRIISNNDQQSDVRCVGTIETIPDALLAEIESAIDAYAEDDEAEDG